MEPDVRPQTRSEVDTHIFPDASCLLFDPLAPDGYVLDAFGALIWDYCDGVLTTGEIGAEVAALVPQFSDAKERVLAIIEEFIKRGLLLSPRANGPLGHALPGHTLLE